MATQQEKQGFYQALQGFADSMKAFGQQSALQQAEAERQKVKASLMPEVEKRRLVKDITDASINNFLATGGSPDLAQQIRMQNTPPMPQSVAQARLMGQLTGDSVLINAAADIEKEEAERELIKLQKQSEYELAKADFLQSRQDARQEKMLASQEARADARLSLQEKRDAERAKSANPIPADMRKPINELDSRVTELNNLENTYKKSFSGLVTGESWGRALVDPEFAGYKSLVQQFGDNYRVKVTGAGATDAEVKRLVATMPNLSDPPAAFMAKLKATRNIFDQIKQRQLGMAKKFGYNTSGFETETPAFTKTSGMSETKDPKYDGMKAFFTIKKK